MTKTYDINGPIYEVQTLYLGGCIIVNNENGSVYYYGFYTGLSRYTQMPFAFAYYLGKTNR